MDAICNAFDYFVFWSTAPGFYQVATRLLGKINITVSFIFINDIMLAWLENKIDSTLNEQ